MTCVVIRCVFLACVFKISSQASSQMKIETLNYSIPAQKATLDKFTILNDIVFANVNHDCATRIDKTACKSSDSAHWLSLVNVALEVFKVQNNITNLTDNMCSSFLILILHDTLLWKPTLTFINKMAQLMPAIKFLQFHLDVFSSMHIVNNTLDDLMKRGFYINSVFVFSNDMLRVSELLETISALENLIWTSVIHITEWIIIFQSTDIVDNIKITHKYVDFITLIYSSSDNITIFAQKTRNTSEFVIKIRIHNQLKVCWVEYIKAIWMNTFADKKSVCRKYRAKIRPHPLLYLQSQKSVMAGLHLPAGLPGTAYKRTTFSERVGNETIFGGFSVAVVNLLGEIMGFKQDFVIVDDGGDYGDVLADGTVTGLTGQLARREAAMAVLMSRIESRQAVIDFLPTPLLIESANIVYRLPGRIEAVDTTYINIFKPEFLLSLVGPLIFISITAIVAHVVTLSCTTAKPQPISCHNVINHSDCTDNICFHHRKEYQGQTARILRGSWSVFCLVTVSAYSAYLVTTFATKPGQLQIRTFKELLQHSEFSVGMHGSCKALPIIMKSSPDTWLQATWNKLVELNKTNQFTFSLDLGYHVKRVIEGSYIFLDNFFIDSGEFYDYVPDNQTDIVAYPQNSLQGLTSSFIAIPKHVFFKDALYGVHLNLEMSGIVRKMEEVYFSRKRPPAVKKVNDEAIAVNVHRIQLILYISLGGIGLGFVCLAAECFYSWCASRCLTNV